jgi:hypothetical protein
VKIWLYVAKCISASGTNNAWLEYDLALCLGTLKVVPSEYNNWSGPKKDCPIYLLSNDYRTGREPNYLPVKPITNPCAKVIGMRFWRTKKYPFILCFLKTSYQSGNAAPLFIEWF